MDERGTVEVNAVATSFRTVEFKLYLNIEQQQTLDRWLRICCRVYNAALESRRTTYRETGKALSFIAQSASLTKQRAIDPELQDVPVEFARDALRRVDRGMKAFFRRCKAGDKKPGFPRFQPQHGYKSLEILYAANYSSKGRIRIPKIGPVRARGQFGIVPAKQQLLRILKRASGWYAQVLFAHDAKLMSQTGSDCGIDLGLTSFLTLDSGEAVENPRVLRTAAKRLRAAQKVLGRRKKGSRRRERQRRRVAIIHEQVARKRKGFCHRISRDIVNRFDRIAYEDLHVRNMAHGRLAKSILDAGWGLFTLLLVTKAESAGRTTSKVDPHGTSQECPSCGAIRRKKLKERVHDCSCGCRLNRDHAAAIIIKNRAFGPGRGDPVSPSARDLAGSMKREGQSAC